MMRLCLAVSAAGLAILLSACGDDTTTIINQTTSTVTTPGRQATTPAVGPPATCARIDFDGTPTTIIDLRGGECSDALRVAAAFEKSSPPPPWQCGLAHAPFDRHPLPGDHGAIIAFSCGYGATGDLLDGPHAFIGVAHKP